MLPIIIVNFNQLEYTKAMVEKLQTFNNIKVIIVDNSSSYQPLLDWYATLDDEITIVRSSNYGPKSPWINGTINKCIAKYGKHYIVTDPDLDISSLPNDAIDIMKTILIQRNCFKVGLALKIDDIPDHYKLKESVLGWEKIFWNQVDTYEDIPIYQAAVDTTFALYNHDKSNENFLSSAVRLGGKLEIRHTPWYIDNDKLTDNQIFYNMICKVSPHRMLASWTYWESIDKEYADGRWREF